MKTNKVLLSIFLLVTSIVLAACGEANRRPTVDVNLSTLFVESPATVEIDVIASDNSWGGKPTVCWMTINNVTTSIAPEWLGSIFVNDTTTIRVQCDNEAGSTEEAQTVTVANSNITTYYDSATVATLQNSCIATGGRQAWKGSALKNFEWKAIVSREALEEGFTLQPYFAEAAPNFVDILGYAVPADFEVLNDGIQTLTCFDAQGNPYTWVFDRKDATSVPFYHISAIRLNSDGSVTVWYNDDSGPGGWDGNGSDSYHTYVRTTVFTSWNVLISTFNNEEAAMTRRVQETKELAEIIGFYNLPEFAEIIGFWK